MKFGKHILAHHVPGWSPYYLDYKFLKKIISSLAANRPAADAAALAVGIRPRDSPDRSPVDLDDDRGPDFHAHKAAFFFKLERELEKINGFYLRQEAELKLRLETLLSKRRAAAMRGLPDPSDPQNHVEWTAVEEGFRLLERDLGKLQQFIEINAIGFRKILKKFDKRSTSTTKELYLSRQVDVQPVFNRQLISELADTVASCLLDLADLSSGVKYESLAPNDVFIQEILQQRMSPSGPLRDFENDLNNAVATADREAVFDCVRFSEALAPADVTRILWNVITAAPPDMADLIFASLTNPFDFKFVDDINGRTCLHQAAIVGALRLVDLCIEKGIQVDKADVYGRTALHYASMHDHGLVCRRLLEANLQPDTLDGDNYTPLVYATMKGSVDCVRALLEEGKVLAQPSSPLQNPQPLSMASQSGHVQIIILLLEHNAQCLPNSNGEYPMHIAAREGHVEICKLLLGWDGWDTPDKYYEWTPLFHAALHGHSECTQVLIDAGARVLATDEYGNTAAHYAGWCGHMNCLDVLLNASSKLPFPPYPHVSEKSPRSDSGPPSTSELDLIPSLSLPPPIMPHRVYGHNYLDKAHLIRITIPPPQSQGCEPGQMGGVRLHPRLLGPGFRDEHLLASTPLRLVMTTGIEANPAPYTLLLPQKNEKEVFTFQTPSLEHLSLEFSVYPSFGTMTIGRAIALPSMFINLHNKASFTLPVLDSRLHVVGEVGFEVCIIKAFKGVTLEIGGDIETYWKSLPIPATPSLETFMRPRHRSTLIGSTHTSPSVYSNYGVSAPTLTISSLQGQYVRVTVQVTRDRQPVIYCDWLLPTADFDLCVCDVTFTQFESLACRLGRGAESLTGSPESWPALVPRAMVSLTQFFNILPQEFGISIDLAYPAKHISETRRLSRNQLDLNSFVDCILGTIYQVSAPSEVLTRKRRVVFTSFSSDVCAFLNWKQPNYPVFYASSCGQNAEPPGGDEDGDDRTASLGVAIEFASSNNLLGVFVDATLLVKVPSLIHGIRNAGLLVGVHGEARDYNELITTSQIDSTPVDAYINGDMVIFVDNAMRDVI